MREAFRLNCLSPLRQPNHRRPGAPCRDVNLPPPAQGIDFEKDLIPGEAGQTRCQGIEATTRGTVHSRENPDCTDLFGDMIMTSRHISPPRA